MNTSINEKINDSRKSPKTRLFGRSPSAFLKVNILLTYSVKWLKMYLIIFLLHFRMKM